ncbi:MAG: AMP-binding protein [Mycobacterium sp.]|uniref:AMP-binding protein n=1 Tax=Mycobacterium sp. TaxID=1785 RepID=UPI003CC5CEE7
MATRFKVPESSLPALLQKAATQQPNRAAYRFIDYAVDPSGYRETVTWSQIHRRAMIVAEELRHCGSSGDRAAIIAPQGLDYIAAFLGVLQAGFIGVPLPAPQFGIHDERVSSALRDSLPAVILTTSSVIDEVAKYALEARATLRPAPIVVAVDSLDLYSPREFDATRYEHPDAAYLQYTSGSTREPAGVVVSHKNVITNFEQMMSDYFEDSEKAPSTSVSWLPFYHDMGLLQGILMPMINQDTAVLLSPLSFLQRPARWMQLLGKHSGPVSSAPNFGFELAVRRTSDDDMAGLDLGDVRAIVSGGERVNASTLKRFTDRFARFNLSETVIRPSYGLAEATLYVASARPGRPPKSVRFDYQHLSAGKAKRCQSQAGGGAKLVSYGAPRASTVRIVDPDTRMENPAESIGEIWVHGDSVARGYWRNAQQTERTFGAKLVRPSPGTPAGPWLRTGDLGVISDGELFIAGRIKDLLVVDGSNHYPDDIEATIQEITGGRVVAISVPDEPTEQLVAIIEITKRGPTDEEAMDKLRTVKREVTSAISKLHRLSVADLVLVAPGSIPITTSGKVRRSACVERYLDHDFTRLDVRA